MWSFEMMVLLSGLLPNPELETSVLSIRLVSNYKNEQLCLLKSLCNRILLTKLYMYFQFEHSSNCMDDPIWTQLCCEVSHRI